MLSSLANCAGAAAFGLELGPAVGCAGCDCAASIFAAAAKRDGKASAEAMTRFESDQVDEATTASDAISYLMMMVVLLVVVEEGRREYWAKRNTGNWEGHVQVCGDSELARGIAQSSHT